MHAVHFDTVDYVVFGLTLCVAALIGVWFRLTGGRQRTTDEVLMGGRDMPVAPVACSVMASYISAISILGLPAEIYKYGFYSMVWVVPHLFTIPIVAWAVLPVFYQQQALTSYQYLEVRFGKALRTLASTLFLINVVLYLGVVLYAPSLAISAVTGINTWTGMLAIGIVCTFYCTLGGMKAVVWTDTFQTILMFTAVIAVLIQGSSDFGGYGNVWRTAEEGGRTVTMNLSFDPRERYTLWNILIGGTTFGLAFNGVNQVQVQRLLTVRSLERARLVLILGILCVVALHSLVCMAGLVTYAAFHNCDPLSLPEVTGITSGDQIMPFYIMRSLSYIPGLPGLCVAGVFSASLSSLSSGLNSLAAVTLSDFVLVFLPKLKMKDTTSALVSKFLALSYGVLVILLSFLVSQLGGLIEASISVNGMLGGPMLGIFMLGMFCPSTTQRGAMSGLIAGISLSGWITIGTTVYGIRSPTLPMTLDNCPADFNLTAVAANITQHSLHNVTAVPEESPLMDLYRTSIMWYSTLGFLTTILVGYIVDCCSGHSVEPNLLSPAVRWLYAPKKVQQKECFLNGRVRRGRIYEYKWKYITVKKPFLFDSSLSTNGIEMITHH